MMVLWCKQCGTQMELMSRMHTEQVDQEIYECPECDTIGIVAMMDRKPEKSTLCKPDKDVEK